VADECGAAGFGKFYNGTWHQASVNDAGHCTFARREPLHPASSTR